MIESLPTFVAVLTSLLCVIMAFVLTLQSMEIKYRLRAQRIAESANTSLRGKIGALLDHCTGSNMSGPHYSLYQMQNGIENYYREHCYGTVKSDLEMIMEGGSTLEDVADYISKLN